MTKELIKLPQTQLAYARAIRLVEMHLGDLCDADGERASTAVDLVVAKLEKLGNLRDPKLTGWRYKVPLDDLYEFTDHENDLLLDLYDAGGKQSSRRMDERFNRLGGGNGVAKGAVTLSAQDKWYVTLTDRGREYIERVLLPERG